MWWSTVARAQDVPLWQQDTFGDEVPLAGGSGWVSGFPPDPWLGAEGAAWPTTDLADTGASSFGAGRAVDNWLTRGEPVAQGAVTVRVGTPDDDTVGLVFAHDGDATTYLAGFTAQAAPPPIGPVAAPTVFLLKIVDGAVVWSEERPSGGLPRTLTLTLDDGELTLTSDLGEHLTREDPSPLAPGKAGFYAYNSGLVLVYSYYYSYYAGPWFDDIEVSARDEDGDGVIDDLDRCEEVWDPDQLDEDGDGVGDACEPNGAPDTAVESGPGGCGAPLGPPAPGREAGDPGHGPYGCGCDGGARSGAAFAAAAGVILRRRRIRICGRTSVRTVHARLE
ncbi:MAG: hypothetical protein ABMA64_22815 [Myxococcota bacterium]